MEAEAGVCVQLHHHRFCDLGPRSAQVLKEVLGIKQTFSKAENRLLIWGTTTHSVPTPRP